MKAGLSQTASVLGEEELGGAWQCQSWLHPAPSFLASMLPAGKDPKLWGFGFRNKSNKLLFIAAQEAGAPLSGFPALRGWTQASDRALRLCWWVVIRKPEADRSQ